MRQVDFETNTAVPNSNITKPVHWPTGEININVRAYGTVLDDLNLDFMVPRPKLITNILANCTTTNKGQPFSEGEIWEWSLNRRFQALLAVAAATQGARLHSSLHCRQTACNELLEIELDLMSFQHVPKEQSIECKPDQNTSVSIRSPTGRDQQTWLEIEQDNPSQFIFRLASSLVVSINGQIPSQNWHMPSHWLDAISESLETIDHITALQLEVPCPGCGTQTQFDFDLEEHLLASLMREQQKRLNELHELATHYHWNEEDIMAIPTQRRNYYLDRIHEGGYA